MIKNKKLAIDSRNKIKIKLKNRDGLTCPPVSFFRNIVTHEINYRRACNVYRHCGENYFPGLKINHQMKLAWYND